MKTHLYFLVFLPLLILNPFLSFPQIAAVDGSDSKIIFVGTYTKKEGHVDGKAEGIYSVLQDPLTGELKSGKTAAKIVNPSFVKASPDGKYLYTVSELGPDDASSGYIHSFEIRPDNSLREIDKLPTIGFAPCHIAIDKTGNYVFVSNYSGGVVVLYETTANGDLEEKQVLYLNNRENSHPHSVTISSDNQQAYIADLGNDKIWIFDFDAGKGILIPNEQSSISLEEGAGPRHLSFSKDEQYLYSINELNSSLNVFQVQKEGGLKVIQNVSSVPEGFEGKNSAADIHLHPSGKFLYASNRGHNSIVGFSIDPDTGKLKLLGHTKTLGETPRNFAISPDGAFLYVANQDSGTIFPFKVESATGELKPGSDPLEVKTPVCIEFRSSRRSP